MLELFHFSATALFAFTMKRLMSMENSLILEISQKQGNILASYDNLKEFEELYQNIDLGIIVAKNNCLDYANNKFKNVM